MKYYTYDWCFGKCSEAELEKLHNEYISYIDTVFEKFPFTIKTMLRSISLHDGILNEIGYDTQNQTLSLKGVSGDLDSGYYHLDLKYKDCKNVDMIAINKLFSDQVLEILSDEFELLERGVYKHSILFSNKEEVSFVFEDLELNIQNTNENSYVKSVCVVTCN